MRYPYFVFALLLISSQLCAQVVPGRGAKAAAASEATEEQPQIAFDEAAQELTSVFPIQLDQFADVLQQPYNWSNARDAAVRCDIGFTPRAIIIKGELIDDIPFFQLMQRPAMASWWKIGYGADGIEFQIENPTSSSQQLRFVMNFGPHAIDPVINLLNTPMRGATQTRMGSAVLDVTPASAPDGTLKAQFQAAIPVADLADPKFFAGPLRITVRLHDLDGDYSTYSMMQKVMEKR